MTPSITHVIFDMDGLLLDTERLYTIVQEEICTRYGKSFTWDLKAQMMGKRAIEAAQTLIHTLELQDRLTPEEFLTEREAALDAMFPHSQLLPGAERLLRYLAHNRIPFCLATSSHRRHYELKTTQHTELFGLFSHVITGDAVTRGKPSPDIFLKALEAWEESKGIDPGSCLVFEDAPPGVAAAKAAGMWCVMVPDSQLDTSHHYQADEVLTSLLEFDPVKYGLPPFT